MTDQTEFEKAVEWRARALCKADSRDPDEMASHLIPAPSGHGQRFSEIVAWKKYVNPARATFTADTAAGYALVPREATEAMVVKAAEALVSGWRGEDGGMADEVCMDGVVNAAIAAGAIKEGE